MHSIKYVFTNKVASVSVSCRLLAIHNIYVYAALVLLYGHVPISIVTPLCSLPMRTLQMWLTVGGPDTAMLESATTLTKSFSGQYMSTWSSVGRYAEACRALQYTEYIRT